MAIAELIDLFFDGCHVLSRHFLITVTGADIGAADALHLVLAEAAGHALCDHLCGEGRREFVVQLLAKLQEAALHTALDAVIIDEEASTVFISDPSVRLDVGAVAKGWAAQRAAEDAPKGLLISVGGNVCATGPKDAKGTPWVVGVQNPSGDNYLHTLYVSGGSIVTSGDYQRYYTVDGKQYHHIIDPDTLYPGNYWRSVTIVCDDSGLADALSTALFLLPLEDGQKLLDQCGAEAMWVDADGNQHYSSGFKALIRT